MRWRRIFVLGLAGLLVAAAAVGVYSYGSFFGWWARPTVRDAPEAKPAAVEPLASGLRLPFDLAFLPDGAALVTERETGRLRKVTPDGQLSEVRTIQEIAEPTKQAGLQGVAVSPPTNRTAGSTSTTPPSRTAGWAGCGWTRRLRPSRS